MMKEEAWIEYLNSDDFSITGPLRIMQEGKAFPPGNGIYIKNGKIIVVK